MLASSTSSPRRRQPPGGAGGRASDSAAAVVAAMEHFNDKLAMCRDRLRKYRKRGLMLRTAYQAAEKVMKVLFDAERAHTVLLAMGEEAAAQLEGPVAAAMEAYPLPGAKRAVSQKSQMKP